MDVPAVARNPEGRQIHQYLSQLQASPLGTSLHAST